MSEQHDALTGKSDEVIEIDEEGRIVSEQPREWTPEYVKSLVGYDIGGSGIIATAVNAALAAAYPLQLIRHYERKANNAEIKLATERESHKQALRNTAINLDQLYKNELRKLQKAFDDAVAANATYRKQEQQLAAERRKVEELEGIIKRIEYVTGDSFPRSTKEAK